MNIFRAGFFVKIRFLFGRLWRAKKVRKSTVKNPARGQISFCNYPGLTFAKLFAVAETSAINRNFWVAKNIVEGSPGKAKIKFFASRTCQSYFSTNFAP